MRRLSTPFLIFACLSGLTVACYGRVLFHGEQFAYRDSAHFYYPLYQLVQTEWHAGRWPLWEPEENSGMPLLGNPTAAVLYPGKLIFAVFAYPLAARLYVVGHSLIAFGAMLALLRGWKTSWTGAALGASAYAFGGPILFQYCNIIYLVGAAWVPLGFHAVDGWLRQGRRWALVELAVVLAMETLGGDPESAYLTGLCALGYAVALAKVWTPTVRYRWLVIGAVVLTVAWVAGTIAVATWVPSVRPISPPRQPSRPLAWMPWVPPLILAVWGVLGLWTLSRWREQRASGRPSAFVPMLAGLLLSAALAAGVSAAQLFPVLEFTGQSGRAAADGSHDIYTFSLHPLRVVEFLWPNVFGTPFHGNRLWLNALPPRGTTPKVWVPSLYLGGLTLVLALGSVRVRRAGAPWRAWMVAVAVVSLAGSFGEYGSPLWAARLVPKLSKSVGPRDARDVAPIREDRHLRDGDGGVYWFLSTALPGFRQFRFPSKLLTFTALAVSALAGQGWDSLASGERQARRRILAWASVLLIVSASALGWTVARKSVLLGWLGAARLATEFGPFDDVGAVSETQRGLLQAAVVFGAALILASRAARNPRACAAAALVVMSADLAVANSRFVVTVPQGLMDAKPEILSVIEDAEKARPEAGPFRVHRVPIWGPLSFQKSASEDRSRDFVVWERATIQPKYGLPYGVQYTMTMGVAELYDYQWFFGGFPFGARDAAARFLGVKPGETVIVFPRRAFDMWNSRYFVLPYYAKWDDEHRGIASFMDDSERVFPAPDAFHGPDGKAKELEWLLTHDYQVRRNLDCFPRAWVVHDARGLKPVRGLSRQDRKVPMEEIVFSNDLFWPDPNRTAYHPFRYAWVEEADRAALAPFLPGTPQDRTESVRVVRYEAQRVELDAELRRPGLVVFADVFYPGWSLTIDGLPAPVYRANRMMRGAAVPSGRHRLVYTYKPASFRIGLMVSGLGFASLGILSLWASRGRGDKAAGAIESTSLPSREEEPGS